jgi:DNA adenine methylase
MSKKGGCATSGPAIVPPLKWHIDGGKHYLAKRIIALMPPRCRNPNKPAPDDPGWLAYCEPYFGGGSVLLANNPEGISEIVNDIHGDLTNFWTVLANEALFQHFRRIVEATPFSKPEWLAAREGLDAEHREESFDGNGGISVVRAAWFFVACRQSHSGRMKEFAALTRNRTRRAMNEQASAWITAVEGLPAVHERLKRVVVLNEQALDVIRQQDGLRTLFYLDPPYLHETRVSTAAYAFEMTADDHADLLSVLAGLKGKFILSGYRSDLYDRAAERCGWTREDVEIANHAAGGGEKRRMTECLWANY